MHRAHTWEKLGKYEKRNREGKKSIYTSLFIFVIYIVIWCSPKGLPHNDKLTISFVRVVNVTTLSNVKNPSL